MGGAASGSAAAGCVGRACAVGRGQLVGYPATDRLEIPVGPGLYVLLGLDLGPLDLDAALPGLAAWRRAKTTTNDATVCQSEASVSGASSLLLASRCHREIRSRLGRGRMFSIAL